jgi:hypothetical protein
MAVGVFGLQVAYKLKRTELLSTDDTHGWFGGLHRIDFSNDSVVASTRGGLSAGGNRMAATGNSNYGWFGGGYTGPSSFGGTPISTVTRIDFSNDFVAAPVRGSLTRARRNLAATGNFNFGWFGGGYTSLTPNGPQTIVDRIDFSNDSQISSPRGPLSLQRYNLAATGNSNFGWFGGGTVGGVTPSVPQGPAHSTVQRIDFSNDSAIASPRGPLSEARIYQWLATGNSNYGWFSGAYSTSVTRIDFANDSEISSNRGPLNAARGYSPAAATGNSNYGWFAGGPSPIDRIDFSNDLSIASSRGQISGGLADSATSGRATGPSIKLQKAGNFGWFGGGFTPSPSTPVSTTQRIDFSNDSVASSPRGPLSLARTTLAATGNSNYGWFGGGNTPTSVSRVDRIDFSNDFVTASMRGSLTGARGYLGGATGNSNFGWFGGGSPGPLLIVDRIDFSNDLSTSSPRGLLRIVRSESAATGNFNYGWFGGGRSTFFVSSIDRIDFSNDSAISLLRGQLTDTKIGLTATGNSNFGWFGGGFSPTSSQPVGSTDRINFSNDTAAASLRVFLTARRGLAASGNSNYGWFSGGFPAFTTTITERIDFSNDTTVTPRGPLVAARAYMAATSNTPIG